MAKVLKTENLIEESLLPCPFCGTTSKEYSEEGKKRMQFVFLKRYVEIPECYGLSVSQHSRYFAYCNNCHCSGGSAFTGKNELTNHTVTEEEAKQIAIEKWNRRI